MPEATPTAASLGVVWIDAQLPPSLARWLRREHQVDAVHVEELAFLRADDPVIFLAAQAAGVAVVISKDEDFVNLLQRYGAPPRIVWVTCGNIRNAELRDVMGRAWPRVAELLSNGEPLVEIGRRTAL